MEDKINRSNKLFPVFFGLSADLVFWIIIDMLFLTTVKGLSASQINSIKAIATFLGIIVQFFGINIIRKLGNITSIRIGTIMLFLAQLLNTIGKKFYIFLIAEILYTIGFVFKDMDSVILLKNLRYKKNDTEYLKYQTRGNVVYSFVTLIISIVSGFLFNISPYLPMILGLVICFINILLTLFFYEAPLKEKSDKKYKFSFNLDKRTLLLILFCGIFYAMIAVGQRNSKLFIQYDMQKLLTASKVATYTSSYPKFFYNIHLFVVC